MKWLGLLIDWFDLTWLIGWSPGEDISFLFVCLIVWPVDWFDSNVLFLLVRLIGWLLDWWSGWVCWLSDWFVCLIVWFGSYYWLNACMIPCWIDSVRLFDRMVDCVIDLLVLVVWLVPFGCAVAWLIVWFDLNCLRSWLIGWLQG